MRDKVPQISLIILALLMPLIGTLALVHIHLQQNLLNFYPIVVNDEALNWHQIESFRTVGFATGYYSMHEAIPEAEFTHFAFWGPAFPIFYGIPSALFGWEYHSPPIYNLAVFTVCLAITLAVLRLNKRQLLAFILFLATFAPLYLFIPSNMQQPVHLAFALIFGLFFVHFLRHDTSPKISIFFFVCLTLMSLFRPTWLIMAGLYAIIWAYRQRQHWKRIPFGWVAILAYILLMQNVILSITSPVPRDSSPIEERAIVDIRYDSGLDSLIRNFGRNLSEFSKNAQHIIAFEVGAMLIVLLLFGMTMWLAYRQWQMRHKAKEQHLLTHVPDWVEFGVYFLALVVLLAFVGFIYDVRGFRGYRLIAPHMLFLVVLVIACKRWLWVAILIGMNMLLVPSFLDMASEYRINSFSSERPNIERFEIEAVNPHLRFDDETDNAWCNTILYTFLPEEILATPAGMGISSIWITTIEISAPLKSKYLVLSDLVVGWLEDGSYFGVEAGEYTPKVTPLVETPIGTLYLNHDAECPP